MLMLLPSTFGAFSTTATSARLSAKSSRMCLLVSNVLIVVIRYFGGIKLGVSGLIQAYKEAAADAINHAEVVERTVDEVIHVRFTYVVMNDVMKVLKEEEPDILSRNFEMECEITLSIRQKDMPRLRERLLKIESLSIEE